MKMSVKRTVNKKAVQDILETVKKATLQVGWADELAKIAYIQEYGANLPGGQPYMVDSKGYITFLRKNSELGRKALKARYNGCGLVKVGRKNRPHGKLRGLGVTKAARIPARFLLLHTKEDNKEQWGKFYANLGNKVAKGQITAEAAINALGVRVKADIQAEISAGQDPRNTTLTAMRKGFNHPLESQKNQLRREIRIMAEVKK